MKRSEFVARAMLTALPSSLEERLTGSQMLVRAEILADEYAKKYPFNDDKTKVSAHDPYAVNWDEAPEWANFHAVDENGKGFWYSGRPCLSKRMWSADSKLCLYSKLNLPTDNWRESLRKRPKKAKK